MFLEVVYGAAAPPSHNTKPFRSGGALIELPGVIGSTPAPNCVRSARQQTVPAQTVTSRLFENAEKTPVLNGEDTARLSSDHKADTKYTLIETLLRVRR